MAAEGQPSGRLSPEQRAMRVALRKLLRRVGLPVPQFPRGRPGRQASRFETISALPPDERRALEACFCARTKRDHETGCLEWIAGKSAGYGIFYWNGRTYGAHRVAYELANGPVPKGLMVRHLCFNPRCVNPEHLAAGTAQDNADDETEAKRGRCKLTNWEAVTIPGLILLGWEPEQVAAEYGITVSQVRNVIAGRSRPAAFERALRAGEVDPQEAG